MICGFTFFEKFLFRHKIIPLTRNVEPLTRKGKQLTRKVGVKFYGFIFWLKRIILGKLGIKKVLPIMRNHYRLAALLHDVFRKPHRQKVYLKPKQKTRTSRFLSTLRFLFGFHVHNRCTSFLLFMVSFISAIIGGGNPSFCVNLKIYSKMII